MKASNKRRALARKRRLARIDWIQSKLEIPEDDPIFRLHELAEQLAPQQMLRSALRFMASEQLLGRS